MTDKKKTKEQLLRELAVLRQQVAESKKDGAERRLLEEALKESENRYKVIFDNVWDGLLVVDKKTKKFLMGNVAIHRLLGYTAEEFGRIGMADIHPVQDLPRVIDRFEALARREVEIAQNIPVKRKDGSVFYADISASVPMVFEGRECLIGVFRDITERKEAERVRLELEAQLAQAQKMEAIGTLAGGIAHDFNNLLGVILGGINLAQIFLKSPHDPEKALRRAEAACTQATRLTRQLLTLSKGWAPSKRTQSLGELLDGVVRLALSGSNLRARLAIANDLWLAYCDSGQIHQAVMNLLINAKEVTESGGTIEVTAENVELLRGEIPSIKKGNYVRVSIKDYGKGIPKENLAQIFDPYFSTKSRGPQKGMGLGLPLASSIIKKHDGHIIVESEVGVGTTIHVYLPASVARDENPVAHERGQPATKRRVLVMDDKEILLDVVSEMLNFLGYEAEIAKDGYEAIQRFTSAKAFGRAFDVVILDLTVAGGIGARETVAKLLELDPSVKAIVSSGYCDDAILSSFRDYGFVGALRKPYQMSELKEILESV